MTGASGRRVSVLSGPDLYAPAIRAAEGHGKPEMPEPTAACRLRGGPARLRTADVGQAHRVSYGIRYSGGLRVTMSA